MIYLDNGATSFPKPPEVTGAMQEAMERCANPGRGSHPASAEGAKALFACREAAGGLFDCKAEQVVLTMNCTHGLNMAIRTLVHPGDRVVISGFEHNAVVRPLHALRARVAVAGRRLFDPEDTLRRFRRALDRGARAAVFTHVSNVFGYVLPVEELAELCRRRGIPFVVDAAQSAGSRKVSLRKLGADFIAVPGHKGLLGPMGTGLLLCGRNPEPLLQGGTGGDSLSRKMPGYLPDRAEAGTANVPGFAGLAAGIARVAALGEEKTGKQEADLARQAGVILKDRGFEVFSGPGQAGVLSFRGKGDCEEVAEELARRGIAVRAGLHCAPVAHESAGTLDTGTVRLSFGVDNTRQDLAALAAATEGL